MTVSFLDSSELIPGYTTVDRIGTGGYGEVWKVKAPGGLDKAIKVIYGQITEERAARELKALNRIKEVRHPFLLSLERIEIVANQLLIVTELADKSLIDRYHECRQSGLEGIPRDELIGYVEDAASALDYMWDKRRLQHLDIKPENLLLLSDRIKVADFGLVKDVEDQAHTLLGGLTPVYAAPEVFSGTASPQSDQYSLAIVYQQMLTGALPFPGRNQQQLATQHRQAAPRLSVLSESDQLAVAKALAKDPHDRYISCKEFVIALAHGQSRCSDTSSSPPTAAARDTARDDDTTTENPAETTVGSKDAATDESPVVCTEVIDSQSSASSSASPVGSNAIRVSSRVRDLVPIDTENTSPEIRPTLFIGLGGIGGRVLQSLKSCMDAGDLKSNDGLQLLLLDTDRDSLNQAREGIYGVSLEPEEMMHLPLRRPKEYQAQSAELLRWLSRRWLYNIPRTLHTQRYRPLGRLAWFDHIDRVHRSIRRRLEQLISDETVAALENASGLPCHSRTPRVFLVGAPSGGTAGGIMIDLIQTVREALAELNLSDDGICSILTFSTNRNTSESTLGIANTYSFLSELQHCCGDSHADSSDSRSRVMASGSLKPLPDTYFVNLGEHLSEYAFDAGIASVAQYLYCDTATTLGTMLKKSRAMTASPMAEDVKLRSFVVDFIDLRERYLPQQWVKSLCQRAVQEWLKASDSSIEDDSSHPAAPRNASGESLSSVLKREFCDSVESQFVRYLVDVLPNETKHGKSGREGPTAVSAETIALISQAAKQLRQLVSTFRTSDSEPDTSEPNSSGRLAQHLWDVLPDAVEDLVAKLPDYFRHEFLQNQPAAAPEQTLVDFVHKAAKTAIASVVEQMDAGYVVNEDGLLNLTPAQLSSCLEAAKIRLPGCGFSQRSFVVDRQDSPALDHASIPPHVTVILGAVDGSLVCREAEDVSLAQIAHLLTKDRPDVVEAAKRLHTRIDVRWTYPPLVIDAED